MRSACPGLQEKFFDALEAEEDGVLISRTIQDCLIEDNDVSGM